MLRIKSNSFSPLRAEDVNCGDSKMKGKLLELLNNYRDICWLEGEPLVKYTGDPLEITIGKQTRKMNNSSLLKCFDFILSKIITVVTASPGY